MSNLKYLPLEQLEKERTVALNLVDHYTAQYEKAKKLNQPYSARLHGSKMSGQRERLKWINKYIEDKRAALNDT